MTYRGIINRTREVRRSSHLMSRRVCNSRGTLENYRMEKNNNMFCGGVIELIQLINYNQHNQLFRFSLTNDFKSIQ